MGVFTEDNRVAEFLKFSRSMLQIDNAILVFQDEPYIWFSLQKDVSHFGP